jgi:excinuclease ABC subunit A
MYVSTSVKIDLQRRLRGLKNAKRNLYLIEEPTIGLPMADVKRLIDIGPEAGAEGGHLTAQGTPEQVATHKTSRTAPLLKAIL